MKFRRILLAAAALFAVATISCKKDEPAAPQKEDVLKVAPASLSFTAAGGDQIVTVTASDSWNATCEADWITINPANDGKTFKVTAKKNEGAVGSSAAARNAKITVKTDTKQASIDVAQAAEAIVFTVLGSPNPAEFAEEGGVLSVKVDFNTTYTITIPADASWITKESTKAVKSETTTFRVAANDGDARQAELTFAPASGSAQKVLVKQAAKAVEAEVFVVLGDPNPAEFTAEAGTLKVKVDYNVNYRVSIPSAASWITPIVTKATQTDNLSYAIAANDGAAREAELTFVAVSGTIQKLTVKQAGAVAPSKVMEIKNVDDWKAFAAAMKKGEYEATETVTLASDLVMGSDFAPFDTLKCIFDGAGHTITYNFAQSEIPEIVDGKHLSDIGLFRINESTIKNLKVAGSLKFSGAADSGTYHLGGIAGSTNGGNAVIENCESSVNILADTKCTHHMGGIVGFASSGTKVNYCTATGKIEMIIPDKGAANASRLGGIVGNIVGNGEFIGDTFKGQVTYEGTNTCRIGGFAGYVDKLVSVLIKDVTCDGKLVLNEGNFDGTSWNYAGGITGYFGNLNKDAKVVYENCVFNGEIIGNFIEEKSGLRAGGIAAHGGKSSETFAGYPVYSEFKNCKCTGKIISNSTGSGRTIFGGVIGLAEQNCKVTVDGFEMSGTLETASGADIGGLLGSLSAPESEYKNFTISKDAKMISSVGAPYLAGIIGANNSAFTTALTGKVGAASFVIGETTTEITYDNYKDYLFGKGLGEGGSVEGVVFDGEIKSGIRSAADLIAWMQNGNRESVEIFADIDLTGAALPDTVIIKEGVTLDGKGHSLKNWTSSKALIKNNKGTVQGIVIDASCAFAIPAEDFGFIVAKNDGLVQDCVNYASAQVEDATATNQYRVGTIVGLNQKLVKNCRNEGNISLFWKTPHAAGTTAFKNTLYLGGVVGVSGTPQTGTRIEGCVNKGKIVADASAIGPFQTGTTYWNNFKTFYVGGVCGASGVNAGDDSKTSNFMKNYGDIKDCRNEGEISVVWAQGTGGYFNVAGIVGFWEGSIYGSTNTGKVSVKTNMLNKEIPGASSRPAVAGIAAVLGMKGADCTNSGEIYLEGCYGNAGKAFYSGCGGTMETTVAGCFGLNGDAHYDADNHNISNCSNSGLIKTNTTMMVTSGSSCSYGAIVGYSFGNISNCTNSGNLDLTWGAKTLRCGVIAGRFHANTVFAGNTNTGILETHEIAGKEGNQCQVLTKYDADGKEIKEENIGTPGTIDDYDGEEVIKF